ncbi:MAG TPA: TolC family protein [Flavisolibacter sp.]|nr:TolC family protein [Flavisolibacter sp.]
MHRVFCFLCLIFATADVFAQTYSLQQCIDSAAARNIPVKQAGLLTEAAAVNWKQARANLLPDLNASVNHNINSGRSIDPFTNTYVTQSVNAASYGISSGVVVFNGLTLQHLVRQNAYAYHASKMEWQQSRDELVLNVILSYLQVLNSEDQLQLALRQAQTSQQAVARLRVMDSMGAIRPSDLSDLRGQLMNDELSILNARTQLETNKLNLSQLMNKAYDPGMRLERIDTGEFFTAYPSGPAEVYNQALDRFAQVKAVELRKKSAQYALKSVRGQLYPTLTLGGGINTNYSSLAKDATGKIPYGSQLTNNRFSSFGLGLNIPIFNSFAVRNRIRLADITVRNNELVEENTKRLLLQQIDQAYLNMTNAYDRYRLLLQQTGAYQESFRAAEARFNAGVGTSIDYLTAKDRLDRANVNLVNARYDFVLRKKILDYYAGTKD